MYHLGNAGNLRIRRAVGTLHPAVVTTDDVNVTAKRFSFDGAFDNLITGDRLEIATSDVRGLAFFTTAAWPSATIEDTIAVYVHVNQVGGIRCYEAFSDAVSDVKANALVLQAFAGGELTINVTIRDTEANLLGDVSSYTFNTERESIDVTSLSDKFRNQYNAGLLTGSGALDCLFSVKDDPRYASECYGEELSILLLQIIQRLDVGAQFDLYLTLVEAGIESDNGVFYEMSAIVTRAGVQVAAGELITCSIDFVTTGDFRLRLGSPKEYILKEDDFKLALEGDLGYLLKTVED